MSFVFSLVGSFVCTFVRLCVCTVWCILYCCCLLSLRSVGRCGFFCVVFGCSSWCWVDLARSGSFWVVLGRPGSFWVVLGRPGSSWVVLGRSGWPWAARGGLGWPWAVPVRQRRAWCDMGCLVRLWVVRGSLASSTFPRVRP